MKFLVDAQLPPALATWIEARGHEATHISDLGGVNASDGTIWEIARRDDRIIVTKDRDFAIWAAARRNGPQVVWIRLGNATSRNLLTWLEPRWSAIAARLSEQIHLIEVGRP